LGISSGKGGNDDLKRLSDEEKELGGTEAIVGQVPLGRGNVDDNWGWGLAKSVFSSGTSLCLGRGDNQKCALRKKTVKKTPTSEGSKKLLNHRTKGSSESPGEAEKNL